MQDKYKAGTGYYGPGGSGVGTCHSYPAAFSVAKLPAYKEVSPSSDAGLVAAIKIAPVDVRLALKPRSHLDLSA